MVDPVFIEVEDFATDPSPEFSHCFTGECRIHVLPLLFQISKIIAASDSLDEVLSVILATMQDHLKIRTGMVTLYDQQSGRWFLHHSFGLAGNGGDQPLEAPWSELTRKVIDSGKTVIQRTSGNPTGPTNHSAAVAGSLSLKQISTMICIPIMHAMNVIGTIGAERTYINRHLLRQDVELLATVGSMIAPAAALHLMERVEKDRLQAENRLLKDALKERFKPDNIIGNSKSMQEVYDLIHKVAATKATVLILGESGVGKELVANAIHYASTCSTGPFIKFNCAALPENIVESELFGHEKGAFTGADGLRKGRFELADGGTIFLDEVGELSQPIQAKLLRVLQERTFERVGGSHPVRINARFIAATNRNLADMVAKGTFREDLYYRLHVFPVTIPPLRDRNSDVILLADHFVAQISRNLGKEVKRISTPALNMLMSYHWPGNVRELENVIERAVILSSDGVIHGYNLPPSLQTAQETNTVFGSSLADRLQAVEYEAIVEAMKHHHGNMTEAARSLGLSRRILGLRMEKYGIGYKGFRGSSAEVGNLEAEARR